MCSGYLFRTHLENTSSVENIHIVDSSIELLASNRSLWETLD